MLKKKKPHSDICDAFLSAVIDYSFLIRTRVTHLI